MLPIRPLTHSVLPKPAFSKHVPSLALSQDFFAQNATCMQHISPTFLVILLAHTTRDQYIHLSFE